MARLSAFLCVLSICLSVLAAKPLIPHTGQISKGDIHYGAPLDFENSEGNSVHHPIIALSPPDEKGIVKIVQVSHNLPVDPKHTAEANKYIDKKAQKTFPDSGDGRPSMLNLANPNYIHRNKIYKRPNPQVPGKIYSHHMKQLEKDIEDAQHRKEHDHGAGTSASRAPTPAPLSPGPSTSRLSPARTSERKVLAGGSTKKTGSTNRKAARKNSSIRKPGSGSTQAVAAAAKAGRKAPPRNAAAGGSGARRGSLTPPSLSRVGPRNGRRALSSM